MSSKSLFKSRNRIAYLFILPYALAFLCFWLYPFIKAIPVSFQEYDYILGQSQFVGFKNFTRAFFDPVFGKAWYNTIYFTIFNIFICFWPPIILAILVNELRRFQDFWRTFLYIPALASGVIVAALWRWIYNPEYGLLNYLLKFLGILPQQWLMDPHQVKICILFMDMMIGTGPSILVYLAALQSIPEQLYEAAEIDGSSLFQKLIYITFPCLLPIIKTFFVLNIIRGLLTFSQIFLMTSGGGPIQASKTLVYYIWEMAFQRMEMSYATAMALIVFIVILGITIVNFRLLRKKE